MRLSPLLMAALVATTTLSLPHPVRGQTVNPSTPPQPSKPKDVIVPTTNRPAVMVSTPIARKPKTPVSQQPIPGTESAPTQETPDRLRFDITPGTPGLENLNPPQSPFTSPTTPSPSTETQEPEASVLIGEVVVTGVEGELQQRIYDAIRTRPGSTATRSQLQEDVNAIYGLGFFSNVQVTPEDTPVGVRVTFAVQPNPVLQKVSVNTTPTPEAGNVVPDKVVDDIFSPLYGRILNLNDLQEGIKKLNQWYKDNGYDLAQVVEVPKVNSDGTVTLVVAEGIIEDVQVGFLNKEGEETDEEGKPVTGRTRDFIITREVELKPGDVFNRQKAERDLRRVYSLGIFDDVRLKFRPGQDPRKVVMIVSVIEKNSGSVAAGAGVSSSSGLFGTVSYQEQNLGGNNQKIGGEIQLGQREFLFDVNFTDPWIAGDPYRTSYTVNGFRRRSISLIFDGGDNEVNLPNGDTPRVVRIGGGITFGRQLSRDVYNPSEWRVSAGLQYQSISIRDSDGELSPRDELGNNLSFSGDGRDDLVTLQFGAVRDRRNNALTPTQGSLLRLGFEQSLPVGSGNILLSRVRGSYSYYLPVTLTKFTTGPQALAFNVQAGTVLGDLPPYEAFILGGSNSVRGYDEGDVGSGRSFIQASAEYRFPIFSVVGGALFLDAASDLGTGGNVLGDPAGVRGKPGSGFGYGAGVRIQSPLGPIRIDYGFNDQGDSRLHFGIGERF